MSNISMLLSILKQFDVQEVEREIQQVCDEGRTDWEQFLSSLSSLEHEAVLLEKNGDKPFNLIMKLSGFRAELSEFLENTKADEDFVVRWENHRLSDLVRNKREGRKVSLVDASATPELTKLRERRTFVRMKIAELENALRIGKAEAYKRKEIMDEETLEKVSEILHNIDLERCEFQIEDNNLTTQITSGCAYVQSLVDSRLTRESEYNTQHRKMKGMFYAMLEKAERYANFSEVREQLSALKKAGREL